MINIYTNMYGHEREWERKRERNNPITCHYYINSV